MLMAFNKPFGLSGQLFGAWSRDGLEPGRWRRAE